MKMFRFGFTIVLCSSKSRDDKHAERYPDTNQGFLPSLLFESIIVFGFKPLPVLNGSLASYKDLTECCISHSQSSESISLLSLNN